MLRDFLEDVTSKLAVITIKGFNEKINVATKHCETFRSSPCQSSEYWERRSSGSGIEGEPKG